MASNLGTNRNKGNSLLELPNSYVLLDVETTGFDTRYDQILEIGAIKVFNNEIIDSFSELTISLNRNVMIPPFITEKTGITEDMIKNEGSPLDQVILDFFNFSEGEIILGYNVNFDINFIYDYLLRFHDIHFSNDYVDVLRLARKFYKEEKKHRLVDVLSYSNIDAIQDHRSLSDCSLTKQVYDHIKQNIDEDSLHTVYKNKNGKSYKVLASDIETTVDEIDESNPFFNMDVCFTGKLDVLTRSEAMQLVKNLGASPQNNVTKTTNYLILGDTSYSSNVLGGLTGKMKKAQDLQSKGQDISILSETVFLDMLSSFDTRNKKTPEVNEYKIPLQKITSKYGHIFLFVDIPHSQRNNLGIASGDSVLLSIHENDSYYFNSDINLISYDSIVKTEEPTELEFNFFELLREEKELKYKRTLVDEFSISKYIHYLPKIKYSQINEKNQIIIKGEIQYPIDSVHDWEVPNILLENNLIDLIEDTYFLTFIDYSRVGHKLDFQMDLPKQIVTRPYTVK